MSLDQNLSKILIVDFGSQFTQLIARRTREIGVFSEIISHKKVKIKDIDHTVKGIILSGGPLNVYQINQYSFDKKILQLDIPVLGICFGHQILSKLNGGKVKQSKHRELGLANIFKKSESLLTRNFFTKKKLTIFFLILLYDITNEKCQPPSSIIFHFILSILQNGYFLSLIFLNHCGLNKSFFLQAFVPVQIKLGNLRLNL